MSGLSNDDIFAALKHQIEENQEFRTRVETAIVHGQQRLWEELIITAVRSVWGVVVQAGAGIVHFVASLFT